MKAGYVVGRMRWIMPCMKNDSAALQIYRQYHVGFSCCFGCQHFMIVSHSHKIARTGVHYRTLPGHDVSFSKRVYSSGTGN